MKRFLLFSFSCIFFSCQQHITPVKLQGFVFGTTYHITYLDEHQRNFQPAIDSLFYLMNKSLSTYIETSDISKINAGNTLIKIDTLFSEVFQKSKRIYKETEGYFDPTIGNLVNAWGFGPKNKLKNLDSVTIDSMMKNVGFDKVSLNNQQIIKSHPSIFLDFNSIAKGYGVDIVGRFFEKNQINNYLVEIGGEIRVRGKKESNEFWTIAIEKPNLDGSQTIQEYVQLNNQSMATSGNYRKYRISEDGTKYVHTINPKTGYAIESNLLSASVISTLDCADVDAYATAFMSMGYEKTVKFLEKHPELKVFLMYLDTNNQLQVFAN